MIKQAKKKNKDFFQVYGINGSSNVIEAKKISIIRIDIMAGGMAEKKSWSTKLFRNKSLPVHRIPKAQFLKHYPGKRTQGIVVTFKGKIITDIPSFSKSANNICFTQTCFVQWRCFIDLFNVISCVTTITNFHIF